MGARLGRIFDDMGIRDNEFLSAAACDVCERSAAKHNLSATSPGDLGVLVSILAQYCLTPSGGEHPLEVMTASRAICAVLPGLVPSLNEADLSKLIWGLGHLAEKPEGLIDELGDQAAWRATRNLFSARE